MRHANVVILTDETEFARSLTACWQTERQAPGVTVLNSDSWQDQDAPAHDLIVVGPIHDGKLTSVLRSLDPSTAVILCAPADTREFGQLRAKYPRLVHIPLREDWAQTLLLVAGESLRRAEAVRIARQAERNAAKNESDAVLGRYMLDMKRSVNNALTSVLGNAELLLLEPGQLSSQSLAQIKTQIEKRIILPFQKPALFAKFKRKPGGGILLYGPPGCGKTLLARATAGERDEGS